jgi:spore coat polysaccharide biosynthesis protein SpsF
MHFTKSSICAMAVCLSAQGSAEVTSAGIIVQGRMGSSRLPGKVLEDLAGAPALLRLFERLRRVNGQPKIVLATTTQERDDPIAALIATQPDIGLSRGPEEDVLKRYADAARHFHLDPIVRITADCPLIEPSCIDAVMDAFHAMPSCQYADNVRPRLFPHGYDVQIVSRATLDWLDKNTISARDREHVLVNIVDNPEKFRSAHVTPKGESHPDLRITLDYPEDLTLIRAIYERLYPTNPQFGLEEILSLRKREPELFELNRMRRIY